MSNSDWLEPKDTPEYMPEISLNKITAFEKVLATGCAIGAVGFALWMKLKKPGVDKGLN